MIYMTLIICITLVIMGVLITISTDRRIDQYYRFTERMLDKVFKEIKEIITDQE